MLSLSFKKGLNDQNHSSSDSHHHIKIPLPAQFIISPMGRYPGVPTSVDKMRGGGLELIHVGRLSRGEGVFKMLLKNACEGVHMLVKLPAISLQACKFSKNELLHTYSSRILARF